MYILADKPESPRLVEAFDAVDEVHGTEEFSRADATGAIATVLGISDSEADSLFQRLVSNDNISEV